MVANALYWRGRQGFEWPTVRLFESLLQGASVFVDVGANVGYYSLAGARQNPGLSVFALEAAPETYNQLVDNIASNRLTNVTPCWCAAGDRCGTARLFLSDNDCSASVLEGFRESRDHVDVPMVTIDAFVAERGIPRVDLIKIDVEGVEDRVICGAENVIRRDRPTILCEVLAGRNETALQAMLDRLGYQFAMIAEDGLRPQTVLAGDPSYENMNFLFTPLDPDPAKNRTTSFPENRSLQRV